MKTLNKLRQQRKGRATFQKINIFSGEPTSQVSSKKYPHHFGAPVRRGPNTCQVRWHFRALQAIRARVHSQPQHNGRDLFLPFLVNIFSAPPLLPGWSLTGGKK